MTLSKHEEDAANRKRMNKIGAMWVLGFGVSDMRGKVIKSRLQITLKWWLWRHALIFNHTIEHHHHYHYNYFHFHRTFSVFVLINNTSQKWKNVDCYMPWKSGEKVFFQVVIKSLGSFGVHSFLSGVSLLHQQRHCTFISSPLPIHCSSIVRRDFVGSLHHGRTLNHFTCVQ